jgi:hypothetical protein
MKKLLAFLQKYPNQWHSINKKELVHATKLQAMYDIDIITYYRATPQIRLNN